MVFQVSSSLYLLNFAVEWTTVKIWKPSVVKSRNHGTFQDKRRMTRHSSCSNEWSLISLSFGLPGNQEVLTPLYFSERTVTWQKHNMLFSRIHQKKNHSKYKALLTKLLWEAEKQPSVWASPIHVWVPRWRLHSPQLVNRTNLTRKLPEPALHSAWLCFIFHDDHLKQVFVLLQGRLFSFCLWLLFLVFETKSRMVAQTSLKPSVTLLHPVSGPLGGQAWTSHLAGTGLLIDNIFASKLYLL